MCRFATNRYKRVSRGQRATGLQRTVDGRPELRASHNTEITSNLTPLPPGTTRTRTNVDDKAAVLAETMLRTTARLAPPIWRQQKPEGWTATEEKSELLTRWQEREH